MLMTPTKADRADAEQALERVLSSQVFAKAGRSRRFLRYLVEAALAEPGSTVKEYTIALDVFDRDKTYDPSIDATVRVEASRLRARLREYYVEEGTNDDLVIDVPKGSYAAVLHSRKKREISPPVRPDERTAQHIGQSEVPEASTPVRSLSAEGWRQAARYAVLSALAVVALTAAFLKLDRRQAPSAAALSSSSLAILPIANHTGNLNNNLLCDGLTDDLIRQLSRLPALKLISRNAVFRPRPSNSNPLEIGRSLGVDFVLTGELRRNADRTSLLAELSNTADGTVLLEREYIVEDEDLRPVQADLQRDVIGKLHLESSARNPGRSLRSVTSDPDAYREFLKGDELARTGDPAQLHQAIGHFEKAVSLDPEFDLAWSALASDHAFLGTYFEAPREHMPQARRFAEHAIQLNPSLGEAHGTLGIIYLLYDWKPSAAAAEMDPAGAEEAAISTLTCTAHLIGQSVRHRNGAEMLTRMLTYDPNSASLIAELGCSEYYRGDYDAALRDYHAAIRADPRYPVAYWGLAKIMNAQRNYGDAIAVLTTFKQTNGFEPPLLTAERGYALGRAGRRSEALALVEQLATQSSQTYVDPYFVATIYASLNDRVQTFAWLDKAYDARSPFMISLPSEPKWDSWRSDLRFVALISRMLNSKAQ